MNTMAGKRQMDPVSPTTFITYLERCCGQNQRQQNRKYHRNKISNLRFVEDINTIGEQRQRMDKVSTVNNIYAKEKEFQLEAGVVQGSRIWVTLYIWESC